MLQLYVKLPVPPVAVTAAVPVLAPQVVFVMVTLEVIAVGCVMETVCVPLQPAASVI